MNVTDVGWFQRRAACSNTRSITITEGAQGTINLKTTNGLAKQIEKTITLGEEHSELLPNGQESKVSCCSLFLTMGLRIRFEPY